MQPKQQLQRTKNLLRNFGTLIFTKSLTVKVKLFAMFERLAEYGKLRMPKQFNKEAKLNNKKHFYAVKPHTNIRAYGWHSNTYPGVFFISHYKYKKKQKLDSADTERVKNTWRGMENE